VLCSLRKEKKNSLLECLFSSVERGAALPIACRNVERRLVLEIENVNIDSFGKDELSDLSGIGEQSQFQRGAAPVAIHSNQMLVHIGCCVTLLCAR
jgi:hypothetical protein